MERISRDNIALFNELKKELTTFEIDERQEFIYFEIPHFLTYAFSVRLLKTDKSTLKIKFWNKNFYKKGLENGFFNLDRLAISERDILLNESESSKIEFSTNKELSIKKFEGIILDGFFCQLKVNDTMLEWNPDEEMNENLKELIYLLRVKVSNALKDYLVDYE